MGNTKVRKDVNGIHVFDRATGANLLVDEISVPESHWSDTPRFVSIALTNVCDLKCPYCYAPKNSRRLSASDVVAWCKELDEGGTLGVGFGGGEPTLHPEFANICKRVADDTTMAVSFTTHGHRLTDELARALAGSVNFVRVSVDGVGATYEQLRGRRFDLLRAALTRVRSLGPFGINCVVNSRTISELDEVEDLAVEFGASELLLLIERPSPGLRGASRATRERLSEWIVGRSHPVRLSLSEGSELVGVSTLNHLRNTTGMTGFAHINARGELCPTAFESYGVPIRDSVATAIAELGVAL